MRKLLTILALLGTVYNASAQLKSDGIMFGVKAGINLANVSISGGGTSISPNSLTRGTVGAFAMIPGGKNFTIQPELLYSGMGFGYSGSKVTFDYLSVPVLAKFTGASGFGIYAGPQIGFLLSAKDDGDDIKENIKSTDFSGVFGADYTLSNGINFAARYQLGFSNFIKEGDPGEAAKNNAFTFTIGYVFKRK